MGMNMGGRGGSTMGISHGNFQGGSGMGSNIPMMGNMGRGMGMGMNMNMNQAMLQSLSMGMGMNMNMNNMNMNTAMLNMPGLSMGRGNQYPG